MRPRAVILLSVLLLLRLSPALADTYPRQPAIDVQHYTFQLAFDGDRRDRGTGDC